jgi:hypothetical protein
MTPESHAQAALRDGLSLFAHASAPRVAETVLVAENGDTPEFPPNLVTHQGLGPEIQECPHFPGHRPTSGAVAVSRDEPPARLG